VHLSSYYGDFKTSRMFLEQGALHDEGDIRCLTVCKD